MSTKGAATNADLIFAEGPSWNEFLHGPNCEEPRASSMTRIAPSFVWEDTAMNAGLIFLRRGQIPNCEEPQASSMKLEKHHYCEVAATNAGLVFLRRGRVPNGKEPRVSLMKLKQHNFLRTQPQILASFFARRGLVGLMSHMATAPRDHKRP